MQNAKDPICKLATFCPTWNLSYQNLCFAFEAISHFLKVDGFCADLCAFVRTTSLNELI